MALSRRHRKQWIELRPTVEGAHLRQLPEEEQDFDLYRPLVTTRRIPRKYELSDSQWEIIQHDEPTENLKKLMDLGYKEGAACRILDALQLD